MPLTIPLRDLKDTTRVCQLVKGSDEPVIVTRNGYEELVLVSPDDFREYQRDREMRRIYTAIAEAEEDTAKGRYIDGFAFLSSLESRYGISG